MGNFAREILQGMAELRQHMREIQAEDEVLCETASECSGFSKLVPPESDTGVTE